MSEQVTIDSEELEKLRDDVRFLDALKSAGVDNWEGFEDAIDIYNGE